MKQLLKRSDAQSREIFFIGTLLLIFSLLARKSNYLISITMICMIYIMLVSGLDILLGYTGQMNTGQAAFYAIGAYTSALLSIHTGIPVFLCMFIGAALSSIVGFLLALGTSRLVKHFLVVTTTAFAQVVYTLITNLKSITRSFRGISNIPKIELFGYEFKSGLSICLLYIVIVVIFLIVKKRLFDSRTGRAFLAIRDNPTAAAGVGINVNKYKRLAFMFCAFFGGFAGGMYAHAMSFISPESFALSMSLTLLTMVLLGGRGSILGPVLGAVMLSVCQTVLQPLGNLQAVVYGGFLLAVVLFFPKGLYGIIDKTRGIVEKLGKRKEA